MDSIIKAKLKAAMGDAFQSYGVLDMFVRDNLGKALNQRTAEKVGLELIYDELLIWAEEDGWLLDLLEHFERHGNKTLGALSGIAKDYVAKAAADAKSVPDDPLDCLILTHKQLFIGRDELRSMLRIMTQPGRIAPVLTVTGREDCGKSYSYQLLRVLHLARASEDIVAKIDFKHFRGGAIADRYRDIVREINLRMELPESSLPPHNESEVRWFEHAIRKFDHTASTRRQRCWLVFDHVQACAEDDNSINEAIAKVVSYAADQGGYLRVVVIGQEPTEIQVDESIRNRLGKDSAQLPNQTEIFSFLKKLCLAANARLLAQRREIPADEVLQDTAAQIMNELSQPNPTVSLSSRYSTVTWAHAELLGLV